MSSSGKKNYSVAIIGGGFAGLGAAYGLHQDGCSNITLFEASNRLGGRTWTVKTSINVWKPVLFSMHTAR